MPDLVLPRRSESVAAACDWVEALAVGSGWDARDVSRVVLAVGEAVANAVEHAPTSGPVRLSALVSNGSVTVRVDAGRPGPPSLHLTRPALPRDPATVGGRGLYIIATLADVVTSGHRSGLELVFRPSS